MERTAVRGIRWTFLATAGVRLGGLATTFVLAHLLEPGDFGTVAFGTLLAMGLTQLASAGVPAALVVAQGLERPVLGAALGLLLALGAGAALLMVAAAVPLAHVLGRPGDAPVFACQAIPLLFVGAAQFHVAVLQRDLLFKRMLACLSGQVVATSVVSVAAAAAGAGLWSLVAGQIAGAAALCALAIAVSPEQVRPRLDRGDSGRLFGDGKGFALQGGLAFVEQNADYFVVGAALGAHRLGLYSVAYRIGEIPYTGIVNPVSQATFPGFARMRSRGEHLTDAFVASLRLIVACALPVCILVSGAARPLVEALLGPGWSGVVPLLTILGLWGALRVVQGPIAWFLNSAGLAWHVGRAYALLLAVGIPLLVVAAHRGGTEGVAWVMVGSMAAMTGIVAGITSRRAGVPLRRLVEAVAPPAAAAVPAWLAARGVDELTRSAAPLESLLAAFAAGALAYAVILIALDRTLPGALLRGLRQALGPDPAAREAT
jgi:PST family polysaccharide transporter